MSSSDSRLPEGTDSIIGGAAYQGDTATSTADAADDARTPPSSASEKIATARESFDQARESLGAKTAEYRDQATSKARDYATQGKDKAAEGLANVHRLIGDAADTIDAKVGEQYGAYARQAAESVASLADTLREKNVDELLADARDVVRKSPAIAIGAAAALGFVLARVVKAGFETAKTPAAEPADTDDSAPTKRKPEA